MTGDTSAFAPASPPIVAALQAGGAAAELLHLPDHGVTGNGHGLIYEKNSDAALAPVLPGWSATPAQRTQGAHDGIGFIGRCHGSDMADDTLKHGQ